eukprot:GHVL01033736.1.p1 GENE.GHVL01033736.1~~GHVL01033736.1.p1  ORF type:complete len:207 (-),score=46.81 GHVL01033736.1:290-910(-)
MEGLVSEIYEKLDQVAPTESKIKELRCMLLQLGEPREGLKILEFAFKDPLTSDTIQRCIFFIFNDIIQHLFYSNNPYLEEWSEHILRGCRRIAPHVALMNESTQEQILVCLGKWEKLKVYDPETIRSLRRLFQIDMDEALELIQGKMEEEEPVMEMMVDDSTASLHYLLLKFRQLAASKRFALRYNEVTVLYIFVTVIYIFVTVLL